MTYINSTPELKCGEKNTEFENLTDYHGFGSGARVIRCLLCNEAIGVPPFAYDSYIICDKCKKQWKKMKEILGIETTNTGVGGN